MTEYCCGFLFRRPNTDEYPDIRAFVVLVRKARPEWQKGRYNGVGGHIEPGEEPLAAMKREFLEETSLCTFDRDWNKIVVLEGPNFRVHFFAGWWHGDRPRIVSLPEEPVGWFDADRLPNAVLPNLKWLVPLGLETDVEFPLMIRDRVPNR